MIRHLVLTRFRHEASAGEIAAVFNDLRDLRRHMPGMLNFHAGANVSPEALARGYSHAIAIDFADSASRDAYLIDPAHKAAGARLVAACAGGVDGVLVIDIEI